MVLIGADVAQLRELGARLSSAAEQLEGLRALVTSGARVPWPGPDGDAFRNHTISLAGVHLSSVATRLRDAGRNLLTQANQQEQASAVDGISDPGERNPFWFWEDGFAPFWGDTADLQDNIPLDDEQFTLDNVDQENHDNCVTVSALGVMGELDPEYFQEHIEQIGPEHYEVTLYDSQGNPVVYTVQGDVPRGGVRGQDGNQSWITLYEAALIQHGVLTEDGGYNGTGTAVQVFQAVTGTPGSRVFPGESDYPSFAELQEMAETGQPVVLGTIDNELPDSTAEAYGAEPIQLVENHAYMVDSVNPDGTINLINPWGSEGSYAEESGTHLITIDRDQYYLYFDGAYLPGDHADWR